MLAAAAPDGAHIEIGASAGYSGMCLALACLHRTFSDERVDALIVPIAKGGLVCRKL